MADSTCLFCVLLTEERGDTDWVWRGEHASALQPLPEGRLAPGHTLVMPHEHVVGVQDVSPHGLQAVMLGVQLVARRMSSHLGALGVNVLNASGPGSDQSVRHLHFHVVPRWQDDGLDTWPQGRSSRQVAEHLLSSFGFATG